METIVCFDQKGNKLWSFQPGKEIKFGDQLISSDFDISLFRVVDLDGDGLYEIFVIACHKIYFPCRTLILNHKGKLLGEYWNSGHIRCAEFLDLDKDGIKEIILGGLNNCYQKACLVILDPSQMKGSSPSEKGSRYSSEELTTGIEKYYILIPQNELGKSIWLNETIKAIDLYENRRIQVSTSQSKVYFEFDHRLMPTFVLLGDEFKFKFKKLEQEGKNRCSIELFR